MRKYKDLCDNCKNWKYDCHGFDGKILCPDCAKKLGYLKDEKEKPRVKKKRAS